MSAVVNHLVKTISILEEIIAEFSLKSSRFSKSVIAVGHQKLDVTRTRPYKFYKTFAKSHSSLPVLPLHATSKKENSIIEEQCGEIPSITAIIANEETETDLILNRVTDMYLDDEEDFLSEEYDSEASYDM